ncbi:hypothetical protein B5S28_g1364 [[Candida] boidinii]|nr:hypothetical protein B5S28_g1364 [[Candida] boidinii]
MSDQSSNNRSDSSSSENRVVNKGKNNRGRSNNNNNNNNKRIGGNKADPKSLIWKRNETSQSKKDSSTEGTDADEEDEESDYLTVCMICAEKIDIVSLSSCNHRVCHKCSFRQRALYKKKACIVCRTENERLIFTEEIAKEFPDFTNSDIVTSNEEHGIDFTSFNSRDDTLNLLKYKCPVKSCHGEEFTTFKKLNEHCKQIHDKQYCTLCGNFKKAFISELKLYTFKQLQTHKSKGDEEGFNGHPLCKFCNGQRFYSDDELFVHLREKHEKCHVCDQQNPGKPQYFKNYDGLFEHFRMVHYVCNVQSCLDQKFVVFGDELDLRAHMIKEHENIFGGDRTLTAIGFGSQLSTFQRQGSSRQHSNNNTYNNNDNEDSENHDSYSVKKMRFEERARHYVNYNSEKINEFTTVNLAYESGDITARELLAKYKEIFSENEDDINILLKELSELYTKNSTKQNFLLKLIKAEPNKKELEEKFPALPGSENTINFTSAPSWGPGGSSRSGRNGGSSSHSFHNVGKNLDTLPSLSAYDLPSARSIPGATLKIKTTKKPIARGNGSTKPKTLSTASAIAHIPKPAPEVKNVINKGFSESVKIPNYLQKTKITQNGTKVSTKAPTNDGMTKMMRMNESKFPALPTQTSKPKIPRVNPVDTSLGQWGSGSSSSRLATSSASASADDIFLNMNSLGQSLEHSSSVTSLNSNSSSSSGKKKKQKQVLFHIGIGS